MKAAITTILVMAGILAVGVMGANPTMIERLKIGGGYGSSGVDIDQDGNVSADGDLLVDGVVKAGSTPVTLTAADGKLLHAAIQQNSASSGQVLKWNGSAWAPAADTDTDTTYTAGTGLLLSTTQFSLQHLGLESLTDPGADRLYMWDESAGTGGASAWVTLGTNLTFDGATLNATDTNTTYSDFTGDSGAGGAAGLVPAPGAGDTAAGKYLKASGGWATPPDTNTTYSAGTGLNLATTTFSLSHLGIQSLADPDDDRIFFWDDGEGAAKWLDIGTNLEISGTTLNATGGGSLPSGSEHQTLRYDDPNGWEAAANLTNTGTYVTAIGTGADVQPLDINHSTNAAADSEVHISYSSADPDGNATPTIGTVGFEIEAVDATDILDADFVVKTKQAGGAVTERFRVADTTLTDSTGMLKQAAIEQNSATTGQALVWGGSAWAPGSVASFPAGATNTTLRYSDTNTVANTDKFEIDSSGNITADGTITAGSGPVTITNTSGKVLMSALEKKTYSVVTYPLTIAAQRGSSNYTTANSTCTVELSPGTDSYIYYGAGVPTDYKTGGAIKITVFGYMNTAYGNNLYLATNVAEGVRTSAVSAGTFGTLAAPANDTTLFKIESTYTSGISGVAAGDYIMYRLDRDADHASDSNAGAMSLMSIHFEFER